MIAKQSIGKSFTGALNYNLKKLEHPESDKRAEVLSTNFVSMDKDLIKKELTIMKALNPGLKRNTYHASLNFATGENISNKKMQQIAEEYKNKMGFDNNTYVIFRHHDTNHPHCHILALRIRFDGTVVSDSNNYIRSEQIIRDLEKKYHLKKVKSSKQSRLRAPNKDELEMIQRTGKPSKKLMLQHQVNEAISQSATMNEFIKSLERRNINVLFNQASTGRVSGITYQVPGFKIKGQALGNQFKFGSIIKTINYEQSRDGQAISRANDRTRAKYGTAEKTRDPGFVSRIGIPFSKDWYNLEKSKGNRGLPEIPFGLSPEFLGRAIQFSIRISDYEERTKENTMDLDSSIPCHRNSHWSLRDSIIDLLDVVVVKPPEEKKLKNRGIKR